MKIKALSLLIAICMVVSLFPAAAAEDSPNAPAPETGVQEHTHETEPVLPQEEEVPAPEAEPEAAPVLPLGIEEYPMLTYGEEVTVPDNHYQTLYAAFVPETSGTYQFYTVSEGSVNASLFDYNTDEEIAHVRENCNVLQHGHPFNQGFCIIAELEAGVPYVLEMYRGYNVSDVTVAVGCAHENTTLPRVEEDKLVYDCIKCGESYCMDAPAMEMNEEQSYSSGDADFVYTTFTPETNGNYHFYSEGDPYSSVWVTDLNQEKLGDYNIYTDCDDPFHGHAAGLQYCFNTELEAGVTYLVRLYSDNGTVTAGVSCAHSGAFKSVDGEGNVTFVCKVCGFEWDQSFEPLRVGEPYVFAHTFVDYDTAYKVVYLTFTAEHTGLYRFYSSGGADPWAALYDAELNPLDSYLHECEHYGIKHTDDLDFCGSELLEAGDTVILQVVNYSESDEQFNVYVDCWHAYERTYSPETGMVTGVCKDCGDTYTEECPALEYGAVTMGYCNGLGYSYATFTPETTGVYRISGKQAQYEFVEGVLYDADMNYIESSSVCWDETHEHLYHYTFCFTQEMQAGVTYVLGYVQGNEYDETDAEVEISVVCGHSYASEVIREATCAQPGIIVHTCTVCGFSYEEEVVVEHTLVSEIIDKGTCAEPGTIVHTCDVCGYQITDEYTIVHDYMVETIREAVCGEYALERYTCLACGYSYEEESYVSHDYQWTVIPGSCTEMRMEVGICSNCGKTNTYEGWYEHDYEDVVIKKATCTEPGQMEERCTLCGYVDYSYEIDPLGHEYNEDLKCTHCGEAAPATWGDLNWTYADGVLTITGEGEMPELEFVGGWEEYWIDNTPWKNLPVREAVIGEGITNVTTSLFEGREELQKVTLPSTVTVIEDDAFNGCTKLTAVTLPEALTDLGFYAFNDCDLREVHISGTKLDAYDKYGNCVIDTWFTGNRNLKSITVDENNPNLCADDQGALYSKDMTKLFFVSEGIEGTYTLPASVNEIECQFFNCSKLNAIEVEAGNPNFISRNGMLYIPDIYDDYWDENGNKVYGHYENLLEACPPAKELGSYTIDAETSALSEYAFFNCVNLTELTIPVTCSVNYRHFTGNWSFADMVSGCTRLKAVWFEEGHPDCISDENGFVYNAAEWNSFTMILCDRAEVLMYVPSAYSGHYLEIPEGVAVVDGTIDIPGLKAIRFPSTLKGLGSGVLVNSNVEWILFTGEQPEVSFQGDPWAINLHADLYYPNWLESWKTGQGYGCELDEDSTYVNYIPYEQGQEPVWGEEKPENPFTDVPEGSFYAAPVAWAVEKGITTGASENSFNPNGECLRAQVVTFLWRAEGCPEPKSLNNPFVDVKASDFYFKAVLWAVENGITNGSDATHFNPFGVCNRAQVVTFLHRAKGSPAPASLDLPFTDVPAGSFYAAPVAWAVENGITNGVDATHFGPNTACNRAQVVTFLYRAYTAS